MNTILRFLDPPGRGTSQRGLSRWRTSLFGLLLSLGLLGPVLAQTPTLEFAAGAGNPTATGPSIANQVITFQNNANNPNDNVFTPTSPSVTATFSLGSPQQYNNVTSVPTTNTGTSFGATINGSNVSATGTDLFPTMQGLFGATYANTIYTSAPTGPTGTGIITNINRAVGLYNSVNALQGQGTTPSTTRFFYSTLTITFSQPVANPVIQITDLGGNTGIVGFTTDLDLATPGVTLGKLSGTNNLAVSAAQIRNSSTALGSGNFASGSVVVNTPPQGVTSLQFSLYIHGDGSGRWPVAGERQGGDVFYLGLTSLSTPTLSGYVFEDVNYGGGAGRPVTAPGTALRSGATVELYTSAGAFVATTTTNANGQYTFNVPAGTYTVRVVNSTVTSSRTGYVNTLVPVQTYNGTTTRVGGENPRFTDAAANSGSQTLAALSSGTVTPESIAAITVSGLATDGPDFGYNFDLVVNTNNAGQGSLRQFMLNANALGDAASLAQSGSNAVGALPAGKETSIFMIPNGTARPGLLSSANGGPASQLTGGVAVITPATALPTLTGPNIFIDGSTQTFNIGNTNNVTLGAGGTVGTAATPLSQLNGPEVQLVGSPATSSAGSFGTGLDVGSGAAGGGVVGLAIYGFGLNADNNNSAQIRIAAGNYTIARNVIGSTATAFTDPGAGVRGVADGLRFTGGTVASTISNNLIGYNAGKGISTNNGVTNLTITNNEIRGNAIGASNLDGLDIQGSATAVTNNLIVDNAGVGLDGYNSAGANNFSGNTISNNGRGTATNGPNETPGVRIYGANNTVSQNIISANYGAGVMVQPTATTTTISQNAIFDNGTVTALNGAGATGQIGIDLNSGNESSGTAPYVTLNGTATNGGNGLLNYPVLTSATLQGTNLVLQGFAKPNAAIELFVAQVNSLSAPAATTGNNFGQGRTYLTTLTAGAAGGSSYGPAPINGFSQGSDTDANAFTFTIPLTAAQQALVLAGVKLTATSTLSSATSEFSGIVNVNAAPVPNTLTNAPIANTAGATVLSPSLSAAANGTANGAANSIAYYTLTSLPSAGTLTYNGTALTSGNIASTQILPALLNTLTYTPAAGTSGTYSFTYTATDANGVASTTNNSNGTVSNGPATYTLPVQTDILLTTLQGPTTGLVGQNISYTATTTNLSPAAASSVVPTIQLPANLPGTVSGGSYNSASGLVTFPTVPSLAAGASVTNVVTYVPANTNTITAAAASTTTTSETFLANNNGTAANANVSTTIANAAAANCATPGKDGSNLSLTTNPVAYYTTPASSTACTGATTLTLGAANAGGAATSIGAGDLLLIVQTQGADVDYSNTNTYGDGIVGGGANGVLNNGRYTAGQYEYVTVASGSATAGAGGTVTLAAGLRNCYDNAPASATAGQRTYQVLRVPQYANLTLGADIAVTPWNGSTGGIFVADVTGTLNFNGRTINASGAGFRGGASISANIGSANAANSGEYALASTATALKGEGTAGTPAFVGASVATGSNYPGGSAGRGAPGNAGGAGTRSGSTNNTENGGGGGGANAGLGGRGGNTYSSNQPFGGEPGASFFPLSSSRLVLGGGGGGGDANNSVGTAGANGGGLVLLRAGQVAGTGTIEANGANATNAANDGGGGGGAGGSVLLTVARGSLSSVTVNAQGGRGGDAVSAAFHGPGGGGGGGVVLANAPLAASNVSGGANGLAGNPATNAYGAAPGQGGAGPAGATGQGAYGPTTSPATFAGVVNNSASGVACQVDVTTTITGPNNLAAGQPSGTFTATFSNVGGQAASVVTQQVTLPAGATLTTAQLNAITAAYPGSSYSGGAGGTISFPTAGTLAAGASNTFQFAFTAPTATGAASIGSTVGATQNANLAPDSFSFPLTVSPVADVAATITGGGATAVGGTGSFAASFTNNGPSDAANTVLTVQLPAGLSGVTINGAGPTSTSGSVATYANGVTYNSATGLISSQPFTLTNGQVVTANIGYTQPSQAGVTATAAIATTTSQAGQTANDQQSATNAGTPGFDLTTTLSGPATAVAGTQVTYGVTTANNGPGAAPNALQTVTMPTAAALTNVFVSNGGTYSFSGGTSVFSFPNIPSLGAGQQVNNSFSFTSPGPAAGSYSLTALVTPNTAAAGDANTGNNQQSISTTLTSAPTAAGSTANINVSIVSNAPNGGVAPGAPVTFTITQGNNGPNAATTVQTQVFLATNLTGVVVRDKNGNVIPNSATTGYNAATGLVIFPTEASQTSQSAPLSYTITANAPASGVLTATASVRAATNDPVPGDNVAQTAVTVNLPTAGDVSTTITGPSVASPGQSIVYTVAATNNGTAPATSLTQTVQLPAGLSGVVVRDASGNVVPNSATTGYDATSGLVRYDAITSVNPGTTITRTITLPAPDFFGSAAGGSIVPVAAVSVTSADNNLANNTARVTTTINPLSDMTVSLTGPASGLVGSPVTYTVTTTNNGPSVGGQTTTVQLPAGLDAPGSGLVLPVGASYNSATGLLTLPAVPAQGLGATQARTASVTFNLPAGLAIIAPTAQVTAASGTNDANLANNAATVSTTIAPATETTADVATTVTANVGTQTAGQPITFTVTATNNTPGTPAPGTVQQLALAAGLSGVRIDGSLPTVTANGLSVYPGGATYDANTGVVTFPAVTVTSGAPVAHTVQVTAPGSGPLLATASVRSNLSDPTPANNVNATSVTITPSADLLTTTTGPSTTAPGTPVSYAVTTTNNGPSASLSVVPTLTLPAGATNVVLPPGATQSGNVVTFATIDILAAGQSATNAVTFNAPATAGTFTVNGNVSSAATPDPNAANNPSAVSTTSAAPAVAPVAFDVVDRTVFNTSANTVNTALGNTAGPQFISALSGAAAAGRSLASYTVLTLPTAAQGTLLYNNNGTYQAVTVNQVLTLAQAGSLKFDPADNATTTASVGDIFFTYRTTDDLGKVSNTALYTIPVARDNAALYTSTPTKGGNANQYQNGDVLAYGIDPNGAKYNDAGLIYNPDGSTATGTVNNGIRFGKLSVTDSTALANLGVRYTSGTGLFTVVDRTKLPRAGQSVTVNVTTVDLFGGITTQPVTITLGQNPLPVELTLFTASAVRNADAALVWRTASEKNNDHFEVERSFSGTDFAPIAQVKGQGSTSAPTDYALTDAGVGAKAVGGVVYYRLKQVDLDGTVSYSPVRPVAFTKVAQPAISLYPNPAASNTALDLRQLPAGSYQVYLLDATGRRVLDTVLGAGLTHGLDLSGLASGSYLVLVRGNSLHLTKRLIKE